MSEQLQQCITKRKIVAFERKGTSVASFIEEFVNHRLNNITLHPDKTDPDALTIVYDTLSLLHENGPDGSAEFTIQKLPVAPKNEEHYWFTGYFLSSEREVVRMSSCHDYLMITVLLNAALFQHTHVARMDQYNHALPRILEPKNYKMINAFDLSAGT